MKKHAHTTKERLLNFLDALPFICFFLGLTVLLLMVCWQALREWSSTHPEVSRELSSATADGNTGIHTAEGITFMYSGDGYLGYDEGGFFCAHTTANDAWTVEVSTNVYIVRANYYDVNGNLVGFDFVGDRNVITLRENGAFGTVVDHVVVYVFKPFTGWYHATIFIRD